MAENVIVYVTAIYEHLSLQYEFALFLDKKRTDEFHHNTGEVSTYCTVIYGFQVRFKVSDEEMVPKYASKSPTR